MAEPEMQKTNGMSARVVDGIPALHVYHIFMHGQPPTSSFPCFCAIQIGIDIADIDDELGSIRLLASSWFALPYRLKVS